MYRPLSIAGHHNEHRCGGIRLKSGDVACHEEDVPKPLIWHSPTPVITILRRLMKEVI